MTKLTALFLGLLAVPAVAQNLRIACYDGYAPKDLIERFVAACKQQHGATVTVDVRTVGNNQDIYDALRGKQCDVVSPTNNGIKSAKYKMIAAGLLAPIDPKQIPGYDQLLPALQMADYITEGGKTYGVPLNYGFYGLAYNTKRVAKPPTSWAALFEPGAEFAVSDDWFEALVPVAGMVAGLKGEDLFQLDKLSTPAVRERLAVLGSRSKRKWVGVDDAKSLQGLQLATSWGFAFSDLAKAGEPWAYATVSEGMMGYIDSFAIASACEPSAQKVAAWWLAFTIAPEQQAYYLRTIGVKPVSLATKSQLTPAELADSKLDDPQWFGRNVTLLRPLDVRTENGLKRLWEEAKTGSAVPPK